MTVVGMRNTILQGDVIERLRELPDGCVQTVVTSPPYWGLRDYGVEGQIGLEATPAEYVARIVEVFAEIRRVLRNDGTAWVNLGDSYANDEKWGGRTGGKHTSGLHGQPVGRTRRQTGLKPKDLVGIPWRVAFALQDDGWYLRSDIIWHKPNPMPESVTDRPTKAHEYIFLLSKGPRYYYDADAIREEPAPQSLARIRQPNFANQTGGPKDYRTTGVNANRSMRQTLENFAANPAGRNKRTVWTVATAPYAEAHFATFPPKLTEPCILAGSSPQACETCGAPWVRMASIDYVNPGNRSTNGPRSMARKHESSDFPVRLEKRVETTGWRPSCRCEVNTGASRSLVLDPFMGSGTVAMVARQWQRDYLGIELNPAYIEMAERRLSTVAVKLFAS